MTKNYCRKDAFQQEGRADEKWVVGPAGQRLTLEMLPPAQNGYWTPRLKAEVVAAVAGGLLSVDDAATRYQLSVEELAGWQRAWERFGQAGLRATRLQQYRDRQERLQKLGWLVSRS